MKRKLTAILLIVCMLTSILPVFSVSADETSIVYQVLAEDSLNMEAYGYEADTMYSAILSEGKDLNGGTGWQDSWTPSNPSGTKLDKNGIFLGRPSLTAPVSIERTLANEIDFSREGTYTFTLTVQDWQAGETQDVVMVLGGSGIVFGAEVPEAGGIWYPKFTVDDVETKVTDGDLIWYDDTDFLTTSAYTPMHIVLEVTIKDGNDEIQIKAYGEGKTDEGFLVYNKNLDLKDKKVGFIKAGYNYNTYAKQNGVSRIRSVKIEAELPEDIGTGDDSGDTPETDPDQPGTEPDVPVAPDTSEKFYQLIAEDTMTPDSYGVADNTTYANITDLNKGTGWSSNWSTFLKLDSYGMFIRRPSETANVRTTRALASEINFATAGTYTFTAELCDGMNETQDFRFELGDSGIVFGAVVPTANSYWMPQLQLPNGSMEVYNGTTSDSLIKAISKSMFIVLEVTSVASGNDTIKVKAYKEGATDADWLITQTAEISDKTVSFVSAGYNYCANYAKPIGVSRFRSVKIEAELPEDTGAGDDSGDTPETDPDQPGTEPDIPVDPDTSGNFYQLIAEDTMTPDSYGVADNTAYPNITDLNKGTGWSDDWSTFSKLDFLGMFIGRPSATSDIKVERTLANEIDFSKEGVYTFTAELRDTIVETQDFTFELGDSGISFGAVAPYANYWYPKLGLPNGKGSQYEVSNDICKMLSTKSIFIVLEVTVDADGEDTLMLKAYGEGKEDPGWLVTEIAEISGKTVSFVSAGFNYCANYARPSGVSRIRSVKIEYDNPEAMAIIEKAQTAEATSKDINDALSYLEYYSGEDKIYLINEIKANAEALGYMFGEAPVASNVEVFLAPDSTGVETSATLIGSYFYEDSDCDIEGETIFKWYRVADGIMEEIYGAATSTYTLTEADENHNIVFSVTPVSESPNNHVGCETFSEEFTGAYAPVVQNLGLYVDSMSVGGKIFASYEFTDYNGDCEADTIFEWTNASTGEILGTDRWLEITRSMAGIPVMLTVTGVSEKAPYKSQPVSEIVFISNDTVDPRPSVGGGGGGSAGGGTLTDTLKWNDDGTLTISGTGVMPDYSQETLPPWRTDIDTVIIEDGVTGIGAYAFYGLTYLKSAAVPESVTSISETAFAGCENVTLKVYENSYAHTYAINNNISYELIIHTEDENNPKVTLTSAEGFKEDTITLDLNLENNTGFVSLGLEIEYDSEYLTLVSVENEPTIGGIFTTAPNYEKNPYNFNWNSTDNITYNGKLATLTFTIKENAPDGIYPISVSYYKGIKGNYTDGYDINYDENFEALGLLYEDGNVTVISYIPGDANGDRNVTERDATYLLRYLAGWQIEGIIEPALDVDGSGTVTERDATILLRYLAGWNVELKR